MKTSTTTTTFATIRCLAVLVGKADPTGQDRLSAAGSRQVPGRQEHAEPPGTDAGRGRAESSRYKKIVCRTGAASRRSL